MKEALDPHARAILNAAVAAVPVIYERRQMPTGIYLMGHARCCITVMAVGRNWSVLSDAFGEFSYHREIVDDAGLPQAIEEAQSSITHQVRAESASLIAWLEAIETGVVVEDPYQRIKGLEHELAEERSALSVLRETFRDALQAKHQARQEGEG